jgi:hypothetical protein
MYVKPLSLILVIVTLLSLLVSCQRPQDTTDNADTSSENGATEVTTEAVPEGEPVETSPDGGIKWTILGYAESSSFAGITAADGNVIIALYVEARNTSTQDVYVTDSLLKATPKPIESIPEDALPEGCVNFGGLIAPGKRRVFCVCFEEKESWYRIIFDYKSNVKNSTSNVIKNDAEEKGKIARGNVAYPLDDRSNDSVSKDFYALFDKVKASQWGKQNEDEVKKYEALLVKDTVGYKFSNVDYSSTSASAWNTVNHLSYLKSMISAYGENRLKTDAKARDTVMAVLDNWLEADYTCTVNWWYNEIQTPRYMAAIGLMLSDFLTEKQLSKMDKIIGKGTLRGSSKATTYTGANLSDMMATTIQHGLLMGDYGTVFAASERMAEEIAVAAKNKEGIQSDGSYFQHGNLLCSAGSYGSVFVKGIETFIVQLYGTCFALPDDKVELFIDHLLDDQSLFHMNYGTAYFSIGRSAVYANGASQLHGTARTLSRIEGIYRRDDLLRYSESFSDTTKINAALRYFPLSYSLVNKSPAYYMAVRGAHKNFILTEVVNKQNLLGYNLSYGANTCYMYYGDEYQAIGAVLDFSMFPGITTYHEDDATLLSRYNNDYGKTWGKSTYTGSHCDGLTDEETGIGALYMELINDGIDGKLSFITYKGLTVALGAGIDCAKSGNTAEIRTSVDQCKYNSAKIGNTPLALNGGSVSVMGNAAIYNGAFAYYNLGDGVLTAEAKTMTGSYSRTDSAKSYYEQSADVFSLYYSYGTNPQNASYAYAVHANADGKAPATADGLPILKITNTEALQAVEFKDGHYVIIFHDAGAFTLASGESITSDKADIIIK